MMLNRTEREMTNMEHLIQKIADIAKRENCIITLDIGPDNILTITILGEKYDYRVINPYWSEESILDTVRDVIRTTR